MPFVFGWRHSRPGAVVDQVAGGYGAASKSRHSLRSHKWIQGPCRRCGAKQSSPPRIEAQTKALFLRANLINRTVAECSKTF